MWEQINSMYLQIQLQRATPQHDALPEVLRSIRLVLPHVSGNHGSHHAVTTRHGTFFALAG